MVIKLIYQTILTFSYQVIPVYFNSSTKTRFDEGNGISDDFQIKSINSATSINETLF